MCCVGQELKLTALWRPTEGWDGGEAVGAKKKGMYGWFVLTSERNQHDIVNPTILQLKVNW